MGYFCIWVDYEISMHTLAKQWAGLVRGHPCDSQHGPLLTIYHSFYLAEISSGFELLYILLCALGLVPRSWVLSPHMAENSFQAHLFSKIMYIHLKVTCPFYAVITTCNCKHNTYPLTDKAGQVVWTT